VPGLISSRPVTAGNHETSQASENERFLIGDLERLGRSCHNSVAAPWLWRAEGQILLPMYQRHQGGAAFLGTLAYLAEVRSVRLLATPNG
jgi:hypothetical protein